RAVVAATLPQCCPVLTAMVEFHRLTGCRPQDVCGLRPCDISRTPEIPVNIPLPEGKALPVRALEVEGVLVWVYAPRHDKTMHLGKPRAVAVRPAARPVV